MRERKGLNIKYIYFNNAAGAFPIEEGVIKAVEKAMREPPKVSGRNTSSGTDCLLKCRNNLAELLDVKADEIVLTPSATYGLNAAILGLGLQRGDLVITTVMEHNSVLRPLAYLEDSIGIRVEYVPLDKNMRLDTGEYKKLLTQKPRLVVMTHASNVTGRINPIRELFAGAKEAGAVTLLDASQTAGRIPVTPRKLHADMTAFPGHKGLRAPLGTGALYVSREVSLNPVITGGTGVRSELRLMPDEMPMKLEAGTPNTPAFAGLNAALEYYFEKAKEIAEKETVITERLLFGLLSTPNLRVFDTDPTERLPIIPFITDGVDSETVGFALTESFGIECRSGLHCAPLMDKAIRSLFGVSGTVRLSPSYMNNIDDIDYAVEAVRAVASL